MKNLILFFLMSFSLLFVSCSDDHEELLSNEETTNIEISLPWPEDFKTRAFSDGLSINNLQCYVYDTSKGTGSAPIMIESVSMHNYSGHKGAYYSLVLPKVKTYEIVFLATSCPQNDTNQKLYYNQSQRTLNLNYDKISPNDEDLDCFWGVITNVSPDNSLSYKVTLKRPFAQLNIGTKDLVSYNEMASSHLQSVAVAVNGVYTSMNVMNGSVSGKTNVSFAASAFPTGQTFPVSGNDYLSMNYLLVNDRTNVNVTMTANNQTKSFDCPYNTIPLQRNYRTNIYGNLLTTSNDYKVQIVPGYVGTENKEVVNLDYDLIFKVEPNTEEIFLYYTTSSNELKEVDLSSYIDSNNTVKVSWERLGMSDATSIRFTEDLNIEGRAHKRLDVPIVEFLKFDISNITLNSFHGMFAGCQIEDLKVIENWDTSNIRDFSYMFYQCKKLKNLNISEFNTSKAVNMRGMFCYLSILKELDLANFDTSNVTDMSEMFYLANNINSLNISSFNTSKVKDMSRMFEYSCDEMLSIDLSHFKTSNVTDMSNMFAGCNFKQINVSNFDTSNLTNLNKIFYGCKNLQEIDISSWNTSKVKECHFLFDGNDSAKDIYFNLDLSNLLDDHLHSLYYTQDAKVHGGIYNLKTDFILIIDKTNQEFLESLVNSLPVVNNKTIYSHYQMFSDDQINRLNNKGWQFVNDNHVNDNPNDW